MSRLYEAAQIDPRCRSRAEFHHGQWRELKRRAVILKLDVGAIGLAA